MLIQLLLRVEPREFDLGAVCREMGRALQMARQRLQVAHRTPRCEFERPRSASRLFHSFRGVSADGDVRRHLAHRKRATCSTCTSAP